ncbi:concanavalin A-like lectin/glucanase domain-containing protein [Pseudomassariella vexata]|uniref:Concanavalin A-like lectin/glucanase domain-containing protein n=1 Tax=Pseudomassariella vexata TaxID=1141098 RepID=A0A1Y2DSE9_9PEZI|nr:concanavalin A-like lectin/glucanase domain-containing protein [Pseudomassariella vexata]ORY62056.1 concanavalin A-like lectin/glucanase domain-containing protein [Pseudomassariella vexata]
MVSPHRLRLFLLTVPSLVLAAPAANFVPTTDSNCNCFLTNLTSRSYFSHHKFFDFRELSQYVSVPDPINSQEGNANADVTSSYFSSVNWTSAWVIQNWDNSDKLGTPGVDATLLKVNSPNNIYIEKNADYARDRSSTYMTMRTVRHENFQSAAEFESLSKNYHFLSMRMKARTRGAPGAITSMFTYRPSPDGTLASLQESDLEVRTMDPRNKISYTNQPAYSEDGETNPKASENATVGRSSWDDWQYHRMDWTPGSSSWYVDGVLVASSTFQTPRDPSTVLFNVWSDGGSWSGNMTVGAEAYMQVQWIEMLYNKTDSDVGGGPNTNAAGSCKSVCSVDLGRTIGTPVLVSNGGQGGQACAAAKYGQCAGKTWNGCIACAGSAECKYQHDYYSQCL